MTQERFGENIIRFGGVLRRAGLPVPTSAILTAIDGVKQIGVTRRDDFYWTLHSSFVRNHPDHGVFDQAFAIFWRDPQLLKRLIAMQLPTSERPGQDNPALPPAGRRRVAESFANLHENNRARKEELVFDAAMTASDRELLRQRDFAQMSTRELGAAKKMLTSLILPLPAKPTRRFCLDQNGRKADLRATMRNSLRKGTDMIALRYRRNLILPPPLIVLCDISGSMERYSRVFLHFLHALSNHRNPDLPRQIHVFVFATRLTNITPALRRRDVDEALGNVANLVQDWSGGTRIAAILRQFNHSWSRRVPANSIMILMSDGLDRAAGKGIRPQIERLRKSITRLVWLNPLLRYSDFAPKAKGIQEILPYVDDFLPAHNMDSLAAIGKILARAKEKT